MVKRLLLFTVALVFFQISDVFSQISIGTVDPGPYTPGSSIAATFTIDPTCINRDNRFDLILVSPAGVELSTIGSYTGFYTTFVNGTIPAGTPVGTGYRVRIKTTSPVLTPVAESNIFEIKAGTIVTAGVSSAPVIASPYFFGYCPGRAGANFDFTNQSTATSTVTGTIKNELNGSIDANLTFTTPIQRFTASFAHYTVTIKAQMPDGSIGTRAYMVINNNVFNNFSTSGSNAFVCLPGGFLRYGVDVTSPTGIQNNYPGNIYQILWGDGVTDTYTFCDLKSGSVQHEYMRSSCGNPPYSTGGITVYNVFGINISVISPCGQVGGAISTYVRVVDKPENRFSHPPAACTGRPVTFENNSILGQDPGSNSPICSDNNITYNWYVDGQIVLAGVPRSTNLVYTFPTHKVYDVTLESVTSGSCEGAPITQQICIQDPPRPAFDFGTAAKTGCAPYTIQARDLSVVDNICNVDNTYNWIINGPAGVQITNQGDKNPTFSFNAPGTYEVILEIQTASCGAVRTQIPQQIVLVDGNPRTELSRDTTLCGLAAFDFNTVAGPTRTILEGTQQTIPGQTYTWTVTDINGNPFPTTEYSFENSTDLHSQYPRIRFNSYKPYKIKVVHVNSCGTSNDEQTITFLESPIPTIASQDTICYNTPVDLIGGASNTNYIGYAWTSSGNGTFSNLNSLTPTYTPGPADLAALRTTITLTLNTGLAGSCQYVPISKEIIIRPNNTGTNTTQEICTGNAVNYMPTSSVAGSTFTWTATNPDGFANGFTPNGSGNITDVITNSNPTQNAVVVYTITPSARGCTGESYTFTVTIIPKPVITTPVPEKTICHNNPAAITINSNISTRFTWTSIASPGITGNDPPPVQSAPSTSVIIPDRLRNATFTQGTVTYTITAYSASQTPCEGNTITVVVKVDPAVTTANAGPDDNICSTSTYQVKGNKPHVGTGFWRLISTHPVTPAIPQPTDSITTVNDLRPGQTYQFEWAITGSGVCEGTKDTVVIVVNEPTVGGTAATLTPLVCANNNIGAITLTGQVGLVTGWQSLTVNDADWVTIPGTNTDPTYNFNGLTITTQFRAIVRNGGCDPDFSIPVTVNVTPATTPAEVEAAQVLCDAKTTILVGNTPDPAKNEAGLWSIPAGAPSAFITTPTNPSTTVSNLIAGQTYRFVWTITGTGACGPTTDTVIVTNNAAINQNITSTSVVVCSGQQVALSSGTPTTGGNRPYTYSWEVQVNDGQWVHPPTDANDENFVITLTTPDTVRFRRIVTGGGCRDTSNVYPIAVRPPITGNDITADQTICSGIRPATLTGQALAGGGGSFIYQWQSSPDNTTWTNITGVNTVDYQPPALNATTFYRRGVSTADCGSVFIYSNSIKITVNPNADAEFTWTHDIDCFPFSLPITVVEHADRNGTYTWYANNVQIGTGATFPGYTINTSNQSVTIKLLVTSRFSCASDSLQHVFSTNQAVPASFTHSTSSNCGPVSANFVNRSNLNAGATFRWNFGNGQTSNDTNPPTVTFQADASGKDTTYVVTLYSITSCGTDSAKVNILVKSPPRPVFSPSATNVCSPTPITFTNNSPLQAGVTYTFNFGDGTQETTNDRSSVTHIYPIRTTVQTYYATLTAVNECNTVTTTPYTIIVRPNTVNAELVVNGNQFVGCAPHTVTFDNNTTGATSYIIDFNDGTQPRQSIISPERFQYTFTNPGTYKVLLTATNGCSTDTTSETIVVRAQPLTDFDAVNKLGCTGLAVKFTNNTQNGVSYVWDFGDGSPTSSEFEPTHTYTGTQEYYTVTLTATNNLGCPMTVTKTSFIRIVQPPVAAFNVNPSTLINIPDYTFNFEDQSTNTPTIWEWDFGDGTSSALRNPSHTYLDTGTYRVTLKTTNQQGCFSTTFKDVTIKGVPGYLFVPNSFIPGDTRPELREFRAKGSGIATWRFSIFNKWGQLLWETTKLEEGRPAEGWDGSFKGQPMPQGVYFWKIDVQLVNGSEWKGMTYDKSPPKRTGPIHLIR